MSAMFCLCVLCGSSIYKPAAAAALEVCEGKEEMEKSGDWKGAGEMGEGV